jgi:hypothetical protein
LRGRVFCGEPLHTSPESALETSDAVINGERILVGEFA